MKMTALVKRGYAGKKSTTGVCRQAKKGEARSFRFSFQDLHPQGSRHPFLLYLIARDSAYAPSVVLAQGRGSAPLNELLLAYMSCRISDCQLFSIIHSSCRYGKTFPARNATSLLSQDY